MIIRTNGIVVSFRSSDCQTASAPTTLASFSWILFFFSLAFRLASSGLTLKHPADGFLQCCPSESRRPRKTGQVPIGRTTVIPPGAFRTPPSSWTPFRVRASTRTCRCLPVRLFNLRNYGQFPAPPVGIDGRAEEDENDPGTSFFFTAFRLSMTIC